METNYTYILIVFLTAVLAGGAVVYSSTQGFPGSDDLSSGAVFVSEKRAQRRSAISFEEQGVLTMNNPGLKEEVLYLVYEQPGAPGLSKEVVFEPGSRCFTEEEIDCSLVLEQDSERLSGLRVKLEGVEENGTVLVTALYFLEAADF